METQVLYKTDKNGKHRGSKQYGVAERKKADLDALEQKMVNQKQVVEQSQAVVDSLTAKLAKFQAYLVTADSNKAKALSNRDLLEDVIKNTRNLVQSSKVAVRQVVKAHNNNKKVASDTASLIDDLIYSADVINKLANLVVRQKALNPLISDELITMITTAGTDANNAVALTLTALKSAYTTQATMDENEAVSALESVKAEALLDMLLGRMQTQEDKKKPKSLKDSINQAYNDAVGVYETALVANVDTTKQLEDAKTQLNKQTVRLQSTEAALAAAQAAALA
ncbi:MAG: hypothetical protein ABJM06_07820 [Gilvibacter sp.]